MVLLMMVAACRGHYFIENPGKLSGAFFPVPRAFDVHQTTPVQSNKMVPYHDCVAHLVDPNTFINYMICSK